MSNSKSDQRNAVLRAAADLFPGYFALVMATGIISIACYLLEMRTLALVLLVINVVAYVVLWSLLLLRLVFSFHALKPTSMITFVGRVSSPRLQAQVCSEVNC